MKILYWITTILFGLALGASGAGYLSGAPMFKEGLAHLGYPGYFLYILGTAKLFGAVALVFPFPSRLKEWAYAGFTFNLLGAVISHVASGDGAKGFMSPLVLLVVLAVSYFAHHRSQKK